MKELYQVAILLFEDFETLDVFGPVEIFGLAKEDYQVSFYSESGGIVKNSHRVAVESLQLENVLRGVDVFLIPGGYGTRKEINNGNLLSQIRQISMASNYVLTVCTGSALLAKTGLLDDRPATSNRRAFEWVAGNRPEVKWDSNARWTVADKYYTSAGVSAGMDMVLAFMSNRHGMQYAEQLAARMEYRWNRDPY